LAVQNAKFTKKADVFSAGIIFLELITLRSPGTLYQSLWPRILEVNLPIALKQILKMSLEAAPELRTGSFDEILQVLQSDDGKVIGELSKDEAQSFDISSGLDTYLPSSLAPENTETR
jgi:serine/threonine protein kinase